MMVEESVELPLQDLIGEAKKNNSQYEFLSNLRKCLTKEEFNLLVIWNKIDIKYVGTIYLIKKITDDIWVNLATDASFSFPKESPHLECLADNLRLFIIGQFENNELSIRYLHQAITSYYECIDDINMRLMQGQPLS